MFLSQGVRLSSYEIVAPQGAGGMEGLSAATEKPPYTTIRGARVIRTLPKA
jgi:hypothetical protein